jgi:hypothetical protein
MIDDVAPHLGTGRGRCDGGPRRLVQQWTSAVSSLLCLTRQRRKRVKTGSSRGIVASMMSRMLGFGRADNACAQFGPAAQEQLVIASILIPSGADQAQETIQGQLSAKRRVDGLTLKVKGQKLRFKARSVVYFKGSTMRQPTDNIIKALFRRVLEHAMQSIGKRLVATS